MIQDELGNKSKLETQCNKKPFFLNILPHFSSMQTAIVSLIILR